MTPMLGAHGGLFEGGAGVAVSTWPTVLGDDWCGQFALSLDVQPEDKP